MGAVASQPRVKDRAEDVEFGGYVGDGAGVFDHLGDDSLPSDHGQWDIPAGHGTGLLPGRWRELVSGTINLITVWCESEYISI